MDLMRQVSVTGREALGEIRRLVGLLRDGDVNGRESGGIAPPPDFGDLDELVEQVRAAGLPVTLTRDGTPDGWGPGAGLAVYRIVQEALTNTMKHAGPEAHAEVRLRFQQTGIDVEIANSGDVPGVSAGGHGVTGMTERAAAYGGRLEAGPQPGGGWRVYTRLPFAAGKVA
jgi:signal transduction histidine kinase